LDESEIHLHPHLVKMWMPKGETVEVPAPGKNRKLPIYGALNYRTDRVSCRVGGGKNARNFLGFLAQLSEEYRGGACVLVLDNAGYHTAVVVRQYLAETRDTFRAVWLPAYSPEFNDIAHIWKYIKGASLANYGFGNVDNLRDVVVKAFEELNRPDDNELAPNSRRSLARDLLEVA